MNFRLKGVKKIFFDIHNQTGEVGFFKNIIKKFNKQGCVQISLVGPKEHNINFSGRCISIRSKGKISSIVIRNHSYGVEQRIFCFNPRLFINYLFLRL